MYTAGLIQARTGSTRLPGKVMYPLDCEPVLEHVIRRVDVARSVDEVVVATTDADRDDVVARTAWDAGATVFRGEEADVLDRMHRAAREVDPDVVVRVTGDCPLVSPDVVDTVVDRLASTGADYATNIVERTFPRGLDIEAFTMESFDVVEAESTKPIEREHVTPYYRNGDQDFHIENVSAEEVFSDPRLLDRKNLRITLDEDADYELLSRVYQGVPFEDILPLDEAVAYIDDNDLVAVNSAVRQKKK